MLPHQQHAMLLAVWQCWLLMSAAAFGGILLL